MRKEKYYSVSFLEYKSEKIETEETTSDIKIKLGLFELLLHASLLILLV